MRPLRNIALAAATTLVAVAPLGAQVQSYKDIKTPALHQLNVPQPKRIQLANGMVIFLMEDHELPLIRGTARIRGGARDVAADKTGLASIYGSSWRTGGTETKTGDQLDDLLEARAARVETGADDDSQSIRLDVLKDDFDTVFPIFVDLLPQPAVAQFHRPQVLFCVYLRILLQPLRRHRIYRLGQAETTASRLARIRHQPVRRSLCGQSLHEPVRQTAAGNQKRARRNF